MPKTNVQTFDTLIIGAGISGIGTACTIARECPDMRYAVLDRRSDIGGTWDLFRYPGIRSDSDMFTFGYEFRPWNEARTLADGPSIKRYVKETAEEYGVMQNLHLNIEIEHASWNSADNHWTLTGKNTDKNTDKKNGELVTFHSQFLVMCSGYYSHAKGYTPEFTGIENFKGKVVHPQHWPEDLDYKNQKVVVVGSGATAVTLVPAMADDTQHITMLQRSPTYIMSLPSVDGLSVFLQKFLPRKLVYRWARRRNIRLQRLIYTGSQRWPKLMRWLILKGVRKALGRELATDDMMRHFTPTYDPWDQRLCVVPDGDLFESIKSGKASVATDEIETFTASGIQLKSGQHLEADIVITATGLQLETLGGMSMDIDGETRGVNEVMVYKGALVQDVPNLVYVFGSTNTPWTLKAGLSCEYFCRLVKHMQQHGHQTFVPRDHHDSMTKSASVMDELASGYVQRGANNLPRQGKREPWRVRNNYYLERKDLLESPVEDDALEFS